ncbi:hypothetical protein DL96DRAFT_1593195 [Flagelloscypha sp. PMI_526]|nr:hypothetical protein DL96DRAFT_1593195 [Flagelloscypha sp. PMI_526]
MSSPISVFTVGGSRRIGYFASLRLLDAGAIVTFLLRDPSRFDGDNEIQKHISSGKARLVRGDASNVDDCRRGWAEASKDQPVDYMIFSAATFSTLQILCTQTYLNVVTTIPSNSTAHLHLICVSSVGIGKKAHSALPYSLQPLYYLLRRPFADKLGMERVAYHLGGMTWDEHDLGKPDSAIIGRKWQKKLPQTGLYFKKWLLFGLLYTEANAYRASTDELSGYTISRRDTGHFIAEMCAGGWDKWAGKVVNVVY